MNFPRKPFLLCLLVGLGLFYACNDEANLALEDDMPIVVTPTKAEATEHFFHAWLADCVNYYSSWDPDAGSNGAIATIQPLAKTAIKDAITNKAIKKAFGESTLAWGPALTVDYQNAGYYSSDNLMYCLKSKKGETDYYYIGIAGTNMLAPFDWFNEDFNVENQHEWYVGGKISQGSKMGFDTLNALRDAVSNLTLASYLKREIASNPNAVISVSGHSLGGALTQVYASHLKSDFKATDATIQAWVYAGPTAGDSLFAKTVFDNLDGYYAYNNSLDIIPHAWQADSLAKICDLYNGLELCDSTLKNNPQINGVVNYLQHISAAGGYTVPGESTIFPGTALTLADTACVTLDTTIYKALTDAYTIADQLDSITYACTKVQPPDDYRYHQFFYHMTEMAWQHTSGYFNHFFKDQSQAFKDAVNKYVPSAPDGDVEENEGRIIIERFLGNVLSIELSDCSCN